MKIIQKYKLFEYTIKHKCGEPAAIIKTHSINVQVFVSKSLNARDWSPAIEISLLEESKGKSDWHRSTHLLESMTLADIDTVDYAINHFKPERIQDYESGPIQFFLADDLILELAARSRNSRLFTHKKDYTPVYAFQSSEELQSFINVLREAVTRIDGFMQSALAATEKDNR